MDNEENPVLELVSTSYEGFVVAKVNGVCFCSYILCTSFVVEREIHANVGLDCMTEGLTERRPVLIASRISMPGSWDGEVVT